MYARSVSILGTLGFVALMCHCGGSTATTGPQADAVDAASADSSSDGSTVDAAATPCSAKCGQARACCADGASTHCVNLDNDPENCGACGVRCGVGTFCNGSCKPIPCDTDAGTCPGMATCCGRSCCAAGDLCCKTEGPVGEIKPEPVCFTPTSTQTTCPQGCAPLCVSDRDLKTGIVPVDERAILDAVCGLPISSWSYESDPGAVRHIGPMAQDFYAAFGGKTDRAYDPIDAHGAAFASVKALRAMLDDQNYRLGRLEDENRQMRAQLANPSCRTETAPRHPGKAAHERSTSEWP